MKKLLAAFTILASTIASTQAASIFSDNFDYADGGIVTNSAGTWINNTGTAGSMVVSNQQLIVTSARTEDIAHQFSPAIASNGVATAVYASFKVQFTALPSLKGTYFTHFTGDSISYYRGRVFAATTNLAGVSSAPAGYFYLGIGNNSPSTSVAQGPANGQLQTLLTTNVTYTVVTRYLLTNGITSIWVGTDPAAMSESDPGATADDPVTSLVNITYYGFRQATEEGSMLIDDLKIGTQFADVAGAQTAPTISPIPHQEIPRDGSTGALPFTVGDAESDPSTLTVAKDSTNTTLVPLSGIVINDGDGTNRTVTVTPAAGQQGTTLVTLTVSDGLNTTPTSFLVTVGAPSISFIPNQIAISNTPIPAIAFTVADAEGDTLTPSQSSSNPTLLQDANITVGGSGSSRTVTLVPEPNQTGVTTVTIGFTDGYTTTTRSFVLTVQPLLGVLLSDTFDYTSFALPNAIYGADGSPWTHASGTFYEVQTTNGWAYLSYTNTEDVAASLTNGPFASSAGVVFYSSFTLRLTFLPSASGNYFAHLKDSAAGTTFRSKVFVATNGAALGSYRIGVANQANSGTFFPLDCSLDTDYLVVTRYNSGTGETVLWVNPLSESSTSTAAADQAITSSIGAYGLREDTGIGDLQISNLVVSTAFPIIPVPAPITITKISVSGGTVTINFTAGASDSEEGFGVLSSGTVNGTYSPASSVITNPSSGNFQATVATAGGAQFYRIKRK